MEQLKKELKTIGILFVAAYIFFQIHYFRESPVTVFRVVLAHFYLFLLPGYMLMLSYAKRIEFQYRLFIGLGLGYALQGLLAYFITLIFHINMKAYYLLTPLAMMAIGYFLAKNNHKDHGRKE